MTIVAGRTRQAQAEEKTNDKAVLDKEEGKTEVEAEPRTEKRIQPTLIIYEQDARKAEKLALELKRRGIQARARGNTVLVEASSPEQKQT